MDYAGVNAKIQAMKGRLLDAGDYGALCAQPTVGAVAEKLRESPSYQSALSYLEGDELHRGMIEQSLMLSLAADFRNIYNFIGDFKIRRYLSALFLNFELGIIKKLLCMVYDERDIGSVFTDELSRLLGDDLEVDIGKLKNSKTVPEFIDNLKGTGMHSMLASAYTEQRSLFEMETQLDLYYYMNLSKSQTKWLAGGDLAAMAEIKGIEVDLRNIMWVWRLKSYYKLPDIMIYAHLIPLSKRLRKEALVAMVQAKSVPELESLIAQSPYAGVFDGKESLEMSFGREMARVYKRALAMRPNSLAAASLYLFAKEAEVSNIVSVVEGVRYKLAPEEIMKFLNILGARSA
ncbi:MAG: V-type ATPase subunit [Clostridiales bacterium]|jgi:V/A-type H+-transporting ATPase subunit C|nr:V-type ATPase subunit [Clostridiales bacterium]